MKNGKKSVLNTDIKNDTQKVRFWTDFGPNLTPQNHPKSGTKASKKRYKKRTKKRTEKMHNMNLS